jgi:hypothetical protein
MLTVTRAAPAAAALLAALAMAVPAGATTATAGGTVASVPATSSTKTQGIIMRDGGICDPIRHMGC